MKLLIVESPNKIAKLKPLVGAGFRIAASFGHIRDLPARGDLAIDFADGRVRPRYEALEKGGRAIAELKRLAAQCEEVWLATDPDREGEAIAWHITQIIGEHRYRRVAFQAITAAAVRQALAAPRQLDNALVDAQQARRVLDRVVGWLVSPTLRGLGRDAKSAGRVQSVALRLVAERELEIRRFTAVDHFVLAARLERDGSPPPFTARLVTWKGEPLAQRLTDREVAERSVAWCAKQRWVVHACERREAEKRPPPPFTTATVQQAASVQLGLRPDATMKLLQSLFEDGRITYHRTDSVALAPEAIDAARAVIRDGFPAAYLPARPVLHATRSANAQEAHEAIRPTHPESGADAVAGEGGALYRLIWQRFIACQMASGRDQLTTIDVACAPGAWNGGPMGVFQAKGVVVLFDGWRRLTADATEERRRRPKRGRKAKDGDEGEADDDEDGEVALPLLDPGQDLSLLGLEAKQKTTRPPPRFTQASLIKRLEKEGIGRPSTYAAIMGTLLARTYVVDEKRKLHATPLGLTVNDFLCKRYAGNFIELDFTRRMEDELDRIARGEAAWEPAVTAAARGVMGLARAAGYPWPAPGGL
jgi:DNA topoisomerase-1